VLKVEAGGVVKARDLGTVYMGRAGAVLCTLAVAKASLDGADDSKWKEIEARIPEGSVVRWSRGEVEREKAAPCTACYAVQYGQCGLKVPGRGTGLKVSAIEWSFGKRDWSTSMLLLQGSR
jgi:hypothetical protein